MKGRLTARISAGVFAILLLTTALIPSTIAEGEPSVTWRTIGPINAGSPVTFNASGTTGSGPLVFEWDFDATDGFQADATGMGVTHVFATPGSALVTLRVTDVDGLAAELEKQIEVDDYITLDIEIIESAPDRATGTLASLRVATWDDEGIAGAAVRFSVFYQAAPGTPSRLIRTMNIVTDENGEALFPIPRDTPLSNLVGDHFATGLVTVSDSLYGNQETASDRADYTVEL